MRREHGRDGGPEERDRPAVARVAGARGARAVRSTTQGADGAARPGLSRRALLRGAALAGLGLGRLAAPLPATAQTMARPAEARAPSQAPTAEPGMPSQAPATRVLRVERTPLDPDGRARVAGVTANGSFPGPELRLRGGETVRLLVENALEEEPTFLHWHGLLVPAVMDGVPGVAGPPIAADRSFLYEFPLRQTGTYWYHSMVALQRQVGLAGPIVIEPRDEAGRYDHDVVVMLGDWLHSDPARVIPRIRERAAGEAPAAVPMATMGPRRADAAGMRRADLSDVRYDAFLLNGRGTQAPWTYAARPGHRIRLRLVNAGASTLFFVSLDQHAMTVTHADGLRIEPVEVDRILMGMGETCDVLVDVTTSGTWTLHAVAQDGRGQALGVIHTPDVKPVLARELPEPGPRLLRYRDLRSPVETTLLEGEAREFTLALRGDRKTWAWSIGERAHPEADPLEIRRGDRVRVTLHNETRLWQPMHLHGHFFRLLNGQGPMSPLKHTVTVAPGQTLRIAFDADNPGRWLLQSDDLYRLQAGMARIWTYLA